MTNPELAAIRKDCGRQILGLYKKANAGHVGASLSCLEILVELCFRRMKPEDVLILSKGHAAAGLYVVLARSGRMDLGEVTDTFYKDGTRLAAHPPCAGQIPAIPFGTGSLGHGLSLASGIAFSQRFTGKKFHVYCILSDGDCNEGSTWEAALFAAHHELRNLTVIVDANGIQGIGRTSDVLDLEPFEAKWRSFGFWTAVAADGNDFASLGGALDGSSSRKGDSPACVMARTTKGHGVSYMENRVEWHYLPMSDEQYRIALEELEAQ